MVSKNPVQTAVGKLAAAQRLDRVQDPQRIADARNELVAAKLERAIVQAIHPEDPAYEPLRPEDRQRLADVLLTG